MVGAPLTALLGGQRTVRWGANVIGGRRWLRPSASHRVRPPPPLLSPFPPLVFARLAEDGPNKRPERRRGEDGYSSRVGPFGARANLQSRRSAINDLDGEVLRGLTATIGELGVASVGFWGSRYRRVRRGARSAASTLARERQAVADAPFRWRPHRDHGFFTVSKKRLPNLRAA